MRLEIKIPSLITIASDVTIYHGSRNGVVRSLGRVSWIDICVLLICWVETRVVTLANNLSKY